MKLFGKAKNDSNEKNPYYGLRQQVLELKPSSYLAEYMNDHPVYASIVDMDMGGTVVSLACVADGTTSLYFSSGGGQLGLGQANESVQTATIGFLHSSEQILDKLKVTKEYPLPTNKKHIVYLITEEAVYMQEMEMDKVNTYPRELKFLNFLYQNVLNNIRESK